MRLWRPLPERGPARVEARLVGVEGFEERVEIELLVADELYATMTVVLVLMPGGPIGRAAPLARRRFFVDRVYQRELTLAEHLPGGRTRVSARTLREMDWLPGNVDHAFALPPEVRDDPAAQVAAREHVARATDCHPARVEVAVSSESADTLRARAANHPFLSFTLGLRREGDEVEVFDVVPPTLRSDVLEASLREGATDPRASAAEVGEVLGDLHLDHALLLALERGAALRVGESPLGPRHDLVLALALRALGPGLVTWGGALEGLGELAALASLVRGSASPEGEAPLLVLATPGTRGVRAVIGPRI